MIWTKEFWKGAGERALKSFAQALLVFVGADGVGILDVEWSVALGLAASFTLASLLTSILNADFTAGNVVAVKSERERAALRDAAIARRRAEREASAPLVAGRVLPDAEASTDITEGR